jgi:hypothetical protein
MDIKIKYKEVDKKAEGSFILGNMIDDFKRYGSVRFMYYMDKIDSLYKEDSKQIESVEISDRYRKLYCNLDIKSKMALIGVSNPDESANIALKKAELEQYIKTLWLIHNQLE